MLLIYAGHPVELAWLDLRHGFAEAVLHTLRLKPGALMTLGPPCKSYVWINSHTHGRTKDEPWGDESKSYVNLGSMLLIWFFWFEWNPCVNCYSKHAVILKEGNRFFFWCWFLRLALRALLLIILATARGALVSLEQPGSSRMKYLPEFIRTGKLINQYLGAKFWKEQFLSETQLKMVP